MKVAGDVDAGGLYSGKKSALECAVCGARANWGLIKGPPAMNGVDYGWGPWQVPGF